jgi:membrane-bound lytic murein transglycosylase D
VVNLGATPDSLAQSDRFQKLGVTLDDWSEGQVAFWKKIYTDYSTHDAILHDAMNLENIYSVLPGDADHLSKIEKEKHAIHETLLSIYLINSARKSVNTETLTPPQRKLYEAMDGNEDPRAYEYASAIDRIRLQIGQQDRLENAYSISTRYLPRMEEMFEEEGVPKELTRLPFVESAFQDSARSNVGAIGIWQFMPKTAMKDLRVTAAIDERYDPLKSTRAAARYLKLNHQLLKNWALAVMAYHHGPGLVLKSVKRLKTHDPMVITKLFKDPNFKFASRNYLFEFLAMLDIDAMHALFFKNVKAAPLPAFITVSFPHPLLMKKVLAYYHLSEEMTRVLNPHFLKPIWANQTAIPAHYPVRLTGITLEEFQKSQYPAD